MSDTNTSVLRQSPNLAAPIPTAPAQIRRCDDLRTLLAHVWWQIEGDPEKESKLDFFQEHFEVWKASNACPFGLASVSHAAPALVEYYFCDDSRPYEGLDGYHLALHWLYQRLSPDARQLRLFMNVHIRPFDIYLGNSMQQSTRASMYAYHLLNRHVWFLARQGEDYPFAVAPMDYQTDAWVLNQPKTATTTKLALERMRTRGSGMRDLTGDIAATKRAAARNVELSTQLARLQFELQKHELLQKEHEALLGERAELRRTVQKYQSEQLNKTTTEEVVDQQFVRFMHYVDQNVHTQEEVAAARNQAEELKQILLGCYTSRSWTAEANAYCESVTSAPPLGEVTFAELVDSLMDQTEPDLTCSEAMTDLGQLDFFDDKSLEFLFTDNSVAQAPASSA